MAKVLLVGLLVALNGCSRGTADSSEPSDPVTTSSSAVELSELLPADAVLVGVTIAPDGKRYVLDQRSGLYEVGDSSATLVFNTTGLNGLELTDVVALDSERFALTAVNDGFLFDVRTKELTSYFCYLPAPPMPTPGDSGGAAGTPQPSYPISVSQTLQLQGVAVQQRTDSVAFNPDTRQLFAQPRTTRLDTGDVAGSELFTFVESGGQPIQVLPITEPGFVAGGMVAAPGNRLLLGSGTGVFELSANGDFKLLRRLYAAIDITGMARAPDGTLWLLDGVGRRLQKLDAL
jgi:hypothetical protein